MHAILARTEVNRVDRQTVHHLLNLIQREAIDTIWVAIAKRAGKIALVCKSQAKCKGFGLITLLHESAAHSHQSRDRGYLRASRASIPHLRPAAPIASAIATSMGINSSLIQAVPHS